MSPPNRNAGVLNDDDEDEEWLTHRFPAIPLSAAVNDTPADVKTAFKG